MPDEIVTQPTVTENQSMSFNGYSIVTWMKKNKDSIKQLASIGLGLLAASFETNALMQTLFGVGSGVLSRMILDAIDYWLTPDAS